MSEQAERVFARSWTNDPTPLEDRTTASILDEIRAGGDWHWIEQLSAEIMRRCVSHENRVVYAYDPNTDPF